MERQGEGSTCLIRPKQTTHCIVPPACLLNNQIHWIPGTCLHTPPQQTPRETKPRQQRLAEPQSSEKKKIKHQLDHKQTTMTGRRGILCVEVRHWEAQSMEEIISMKVAASSPSFTLAFLPPSHTEASRHAVPSHPSPTAASASSSHLSPPRLHNTTVVISRICCWSCAAVRPLVKSLQAKAGSLEEDYSPRAPIMD